MSYIHKIEYYSAIKKNKILFAATWMNLQTVILSDVRLRKTKYTVPLICGILKKNDTNELSYKTQTYSET